MWRVMKGFHESESVKPNSRKIGVLVFWRWNSERQKLTPWVAVVNTLATVNESQLVGNQSGEPLVPCTTDWIGSCLKKIPLITRQYHFKFCTSNKGMVTLMECNDSNETGYQLTSDVSLADDFPDVIRPQGLPLQRQWYLHDKILVFCYIDTRDLRL